MKYLFWSPIDDCVERYLVENKTLGMLGDSLVPVASGKTAPRMCKKIFGNVIQCHNSMRDKMNVIFEFAETREWDVLVKIDCECAIIDISTLYNMLELHVEPMSAAGVVGNMNGKIYLRGGCYAAHRSIFPIVLGKEPKNKEDILFADACARRGVDLIDIPLFEIGPRWTGVAPLWHPPKCGGGRESIPRRLQIFAAEMNRLQI